VRPAAEIQTSTIPVWQSGRKHGWSGGESLLIFSFISHMNIQVYCEEWIAAGWEADVFFADKQNTRGLSPKAIIRRRNPHETTNRDSGAYFCPGDLRNARASGPACVLAAPKGQL